MIEREKSLLPFLWELLKGYPKVGAICVMIGLGLSFYGLVVLKKEQKLFKILSAYLLVISLWDIVNIIALYYLGSVKLTYKIIDLLEFLFMSIILSNVIKQTNRNILVQILLVAGLGVFLDTLISGFWGRGEYSVLLYHFYVVILCVFFFYRLLKEIYNHKVDQVAIFWIVSGILIYQSTTFLIFGTKSILAINEGLQNLWGLVHVSRLVMYVFFVFAFYLTSKKWIQLRSV